MLTLDRPTTMRFVGEEPGRAYVQVTVPRAATERVDQADDEKLVAKKAARELAGRVGRAVSLGELRIERASHGRYHVSIVHLENVRVKAKAGGLRRAVLRLCEWLADGTPCWYLHRQQTLGGRFMNAIARAYQWAAARG